MTTHSCPRQRPKLSSTQPWRGGVWAAQIQPSLLRSRDPSSRMVPSSKGPAAAGLRSRLAIVAGPAAALVAVIVHAGVSGNDPPVDRRSYFVFLGVVLGVFVL